MGKASLRLVKTCLTPLMPDQQVIEFANDFQKHSEQSATGGKPLIDKGVSKACTQSTALASTKIPRAGRFSLIRQACL
ncbi:hypothetical protein JHL21_08625 [Devosia sp. WQ 349]|nr:hypothetical protein [Devosia sp. WQ 349K1]